MRILLAGQAYYREDNGQATFTVRLARMLAQVGHRVMVLCPRDRGGRSEEIVAGVQVYRFPALGLPHNANLTRVPVWRMTDLLQGLAPDLIHLQDHYFLSRSVQRAAVRLGVPVVATNHFLPRNLSANLPLPAWLRCQVERLLWRHMLRFANQLTAVATPTRTAACLLAEQGLEAPLRPISCGVDTNRFRPGLTDAAQRLRRRLGLGENAVTLLYVGRLDGEKGLEELVAGFAAISDSRCRLVIAGQGSRAKGLRQRVAALNQSWRILLPGFIPAQDLPGLYNAASAFVMAGQAELQSIATLEAMACGLPILAARACALPELVTPEQNGFLFAPGSASSLARAIQTFLAVEERWPALGRISRERALEHDIARSVRQYQRWYRACCQGAPGPARSTVGLAAREIALRQG